MPDSSTVAVNVAVGGLAMQLMWTAIGALLFTLLWRYAIKHYSAVGT